MRIVVLGGLGLQGQAALLDLAASPDVTDIICADATATLPSTIAGWPNMAKVKCTTVNASSKEEISSLFKHYKPQAAIDLLPQPLMRNAFEAAVESRVSILSTNYRYPLVDLDTPAREAGVVLLPECGLDPGIDLVLIGQGVREFDQVEVLNSYCGGIPEAKAAGNLLKYKISWNWDMVLSSQMRPAVFIHEGQRLDISPAEQHEKMIHSVFFPGLGELEALPNGNAAAYIEPLGLTSSIRETGRYSLRWPGWCAVWRVIKGLGLLDETPVQGLPAPITPRQFLARMMEPKLHYQSDEKDLAVMVNIF
ncbi:MAG: saccharopine dehydrogenase NADP-binding domain-containing protein, partial [Deltaproteobacteria bacterium]|nr:saccharopine dehydrogenase NADP-binding domain-containing protein [Deltaproteobacteria bacterium]